MPQALQEARPRSYDITLRPLKPGSTQVGGTSADGPSRGKSRAVGLSGLRTADRTGSHTHSPRACVWANCSVPIRGRYSRPSRKVALLHECYALVRRSDGSGNTLEMRIWPAIDYRKRACDVRVLRQGNCSSWSGDERKRRMTREEAHGTGATGSVADGGL